MRQITIQQQLWDLVNKSLVSSEFIGSDCAGVKQMYDRVPIAALNFNKSMVDQCIRMGSCGKSETIK
jgi:hypothetical protein